MYNPQYPMHAKHKNLWNVVIISKIGFKETSLFKSHILAWNSSSTQQLVWLHGLATSRHAISRFVHIDSSTFLLQGITSTCCSTLKLWWISLVPWNFLPFQPCNPLTVCWNPLKNNWNFLENATGNSWKLLEKSTWNPTFSFCPSSLFPTKFLTLWQKKL